MKIISLLVLLTIFVSHSVSYDLVFNTDKDILQWKFNGSYIYSKSIPNVAVLLPASLVRSSKENDVFRVGVWLTRYSGPDAENYLSLQYALKHHLFKQGHVHFIASPNVPLTITTNNNQEVGKFWSDGRTWCDAVFSVNLHNQIKIDIETPRAGDYALIDRVIMGVMDNIAMGGKRLNPCLTSPPSLESISEDDMAPDMAHKVHSNVTHADHSPPDMVNKPAHSHHLRGSSGGAVPSTPAPPPDMLEKNQAPRLDTSTTTTSDDNETEPQAEDTDPSNVKCGCSCSCSRVKGKKNASNNSTMTMSG